MMQETTLTQVRSVASFYPNSPLNNVTMIYLKNKYNYKEYPHLKFLQPNIHKGSC